MFLVVATALLTLGLGAGTAAAGEPRGLIAENRPQGVWLFEKDGSGARQVFPGTATSGITWTPDGSAFVFASRFDPHTGQQLPGERLFMAEADAASARQVTFDWCVLDGVGVGGAGGGGAPVSSRRWVDDDLCGPGTARPSGDHHNPQAVIAGGRPWVRFEWSNDRFSDAGIVTEYTVWALPLDRHGARPGWIGYGRLPSSPVVNDGVVHVQTPFRFETGDSDPPGSDRIAIIPWIPGPDCDPTGPEDHLGSRVSLHWGPGCPPLYQDIMDLDQPPEPTVVVDDADAPAVAPDGSVLARRELCPPGTDRAGTSRALRAGTTFMGVGCDGFIFPPAVRCMEPRQRAAAVGTHRVRPGDR